MEMKKTSQPNEGSVLIITMMTLTIMTLIAATSLYVVSQNTNSGMQTAGWQQALTGAESGVDSAIRALNAFASPAPGVSPSDAWTKAGWVKVTGTTLPTTEASVAPSPTATATGMPDSTHFNYLPSSQLQIGSFTGSEGASQVNSWVTVDTAGLSSNWVRVRAIGQTRYPANSAILRWSAMNRLDNELRNTISLKFNRKTALAATATTQGPTRTIEVVLAAVTNSIWGMGGLLKGALTMSGGGTMDHFNSNNILNHQYSTAARSSDNTEMLIGMLNGNGSNLSNTFVYGAISYSTTGAVPKNTTNVQGGLTSPFNGTPPTTSDPVWTPDQTYSAAGLPALITVPSNTTSGNPYKVKVTGNLTVPGGKSLTIQRQNNGASTLYVEIWTTGSLTTSGTGYISVDNNVHVTYYVDGSVTTSGGSMNNVSGTGQAQNNQIVVVGSGDVTVSGSGQFIGTIEAPNSSITISGSGSLVGAVIGNTMTISGGASLHFDDALSTFGGGSTTTGSYSFASWFEDNSDVKRLDSNMNRIVY